MRKEVSPAEVERRARQGFQAKVMEVATVTRRAPASIYRAIHRGEIEAVWLGSAPMLTPEATLRLLGKSAEPIAA